MSTSRTNPGIDVLVQRMVGLSGETIATKERRALINGRPIEESFLPTVMTTEAITEITLGENEFYVLGDNRPGSADSRSYGPVLRSPIEREVKGTFSPIERRTEF